MHLFFLNAKDHAQDTGEQFRAFPYNNFHDDPPCHGSRHKIPNTRTAMDNGNRHWGKQLSNMPNSPIQIHLIPRDSGRRTRHFPGRFIANPPFGHCFEPFYASGQKVVILSFGPAFLQRMRPFYRKKENGRTFFYTNVRPLKSIRVCQLTTVL